MNIERRPTVVVHHERDGSISYHATPGVDLYVIDENTPNDRVYRCMSVATDHEIEQLIGTSPVGHAGDDFHKEASELIRSVGLALEHNTFN